MQAFQVSHPSYLLYSPTKLYRTLWQDAYTRWRRFFLYYVWSMLVLHGHWYSFLLLLFYILLSSATGLLARVHPSYINTHPVLRHRTLTKFSRTQQTTAINQQHQTQKEYRNPTWIVHWFLAAVFYKISPIFICLIFILILVLHLMIAFLNDFQHPSSKFLKAVGQFVSDLVVNIAIDYIYT